MSLVSGRMISGLFLTITAVVLISCDTPDDPEEVTCSLNNVDIPTESVSATLAKPFGQRIQAAFDQLEKLNLSVLVGVSHHGDAVIYKEFGKLKEDGIDPQNTQVDINSVTKTVTGIMILKLVEEGKLRFTDHLGTIYSSVPADKSAITVHQLLTHSAGFPEAIGDDYEIIERDQYLERAFNTPLEHLPGTKYLYSNVGYSILAAIIEKTTNQSYEKFLLGNILRNTDLEDTGYDSIYSQNRGLIADDERTIKDASWGGHKPYWNLIGNGGLLSTAQDLIQLIKMEKDGAIVSADLVAESRKAHISESNFGYTFYGYGLVVQEVPQIGKVYWHDGGNDIFSAKWADFTSQGDILFTAGVDKKGCTAITAMSILQLYLYGVALE